MTKNCKKFTAEKKNLDKKLQFTSIKDVQKKPSALKREHPGLQNMKFLKKILPL
jgi:hypothetical protein